ncbi:hypothetical protein [Silvanigrella aquatica]|uniref:Response regulatory domain-containing protein n=1 Tax=Silvanigrella aquatica TaxID=1915309 RepID=A0A1L4CXK9_9BACT|nr:hypothetical protein [Silvanigrella aquatica]APJ02678.1 hypothetical protein AXG55_01525 [Silvanigrella aquatica]
MINVAIIDDEDFYHNIWKHSLSKDCQLFSYNDPDEFIDNNLNNLNKFEYIITDIMYGNMNILNINFSKLIRKNKFNKDIILCSNYKQNEDELEKFHYYDLILEKDRRYSLSEIKKRLDHNRINWRGRLQSFNDNIIL